MAWTRSIRSPRTRARLAALALAAGVASMAQMAGGAPLPPHRDGNIAIAEELVAARRAGTIAAYDLFLARHPTHKLARSARRERAALSNRLRQQSR